MSIRLFSSIERDMNTLVECTSNLTIIRVKSEKKMDGVSTHLPTRPQYDSVLITVLLLHT